MYRYLITMLSLLIVSFVIAKSNSKYRNILIVINLIACIIYLIWRISAIPIHDGLFSLIMGIILYLAETFGIISFFNFQYLFMKRYRLVAKSLQDYQDGEVPFVDVLICTYNEPKELLLMTMMAASNLNYPKDRFKVHLCDDGRRNEIRKLCKKYDIDYITRDDNVGAKAGNINNALKQIHGDLFAVLDADMLPKENFLQRTVGYFVDKDVAFVQTPQVYYNKDMYQYNLKRKLPNEQDFFMRDIQEARAANNAVLHVGTNALFKRSYVLGIGGYPTWSITEDMAVGMLLQAAGYRSVFVNEELVFGLSATTFQELVKQRDRWCRGNLQVQKRHNPLFTKGLTMAQKIAYIDGTMYWFANIQKMVYIICPLLYLIFHTVILRCTLPELMSMYIPFFVGQILIFKILLPNTRSMLWAHYYEIVMAPHLVISVLKEMLNINVKFNVTAKDTVFDRRFFQLRMVMPHLILMGITIFAWYLAYIGLKNGTINFGSYLLNMFWSSYNIAGIVIALKVAWQKPIYRKVERIKIMQYVPIEIEYQQKHYHGVIKDISGAGIGILMDEAFIAEKGKLVHIYLNGLRLSCRIVRENGRWLAVRYGNLTPDEYKTLMKLLTSNLTTQFDVHRTQKYHQENSPVNVMKLSVH